MTEASTAKGLAVLCRFLRAQLRGRDMRRRFP